MNRHPRPGIPVTKLLISNHLLQVTFQIECRYGRKFRRQMALQLLNQISPALRDISEYSIRHSDSHPLNWFHEDRGVSLKSSCRSGVNGLQWRLRRLELGLTLRELSALAKVNYEHLSRIERGLTNPSLRTEMKLERILRPSARESVPVVSRRQSRASGRSATAKQPRSRA